MTCQVDKAAFSPYRYSAVRAAAQVNVPLTDDIYMSHKMCISSSLLWPGAPLATWTCTCDGVNPPLLLLDMFDPPEMLSVFHQQTIRHVSVRLIALVWREGCRGIKVNHCTLRFVVKPTNFPLIGSCNEVQVVTWPLRQSLKMFLVSTSVLPAHTSWRSTSESHFSSKWI